jgi:hypothetical protein
MNLLFQTHIVEVATNNRHRASVFGHDGVVKNKNLDSVFIGFAFSATLLAKAGLWTIF